MMTSCRTPVLRWLLVAMAAIILAGCAGVELPQPPIADVAPQRDERRDEAVRQFEQQRDDAQYQTALHRWEQGDAAGCETELARLLQRNPEHQRGQLLMADVLMSQGRVANAEAGLRTAVENDPNWESLLALGLLLETSGRRPEAISHLRRAATLAPNNVVLREALTALEADEAAGIAPVVHMAPIVPATPTAVAAGRDTSAGYLHQSPAPPSLTAFASTETGRLLLSEAESVLAAGDLSQAAVLLHDAVHAEPQNQQLPYSTSVALLRGGHAPLAVDLLEAAVTLHPRHVHLQRLHGAALIEAERFAEAQVALQQALSLDNSSALTYFLLGISLEAQGQAEAARLHRLQATKLDPRFSAIP